MQTTPNLGLKKPEGTDVVDIADLNSNADVLDAEVAKKASATADGRMSKEDFAKLAGIAAGANNYVHPATHPASVIVQDASNRFATDAEKAAWNAKASTAVATTSVNGLMSAADKGKLDGVAAGANNYVHPATHPASVIAQDASNRFVTDAEKAAWNAKASTAVATTSASGLMSAADKGKLDGVAAGANNYVHPATHPASVIAQDASNRFVTDTEKAAWNGKASTAVATTSASGLMSAADKGKLDGVAAGAGTANSATDAVIGSRTVNDTAAPTFTGTLTTLLSGVMSLLKRITGEAGALTAPVKSLRQLNDEKFDKAGGLISGGVTLQGGVAVQSADMLIFGPNSTYPSGAASLKVGGIRVTDDYNEVRAEPGVLSAKYGVHTDGGYWMGGQQLALTRVNNGGLEYWSGSGWQAVSGGVKNVQRGTAIVHAGNSTDVTITAVNLSKAYLIISSGEKILNYENPFFARGELTSSTNIRLYGMAHSIAINVPCHWQVIEYN
ncbi:hypothetical protein SAMN02799630_03950 [Paenibacillus sp. UNCCL117]|uniref:hypothetical protein n=1 Tax=unclassified Paenibacillus TaxID=185978 RepID=UPI0008852A5E|nr:MULTISPECIES: hypothetical protein [unclassified Paenibacillus]SDD75764.1 hypothetical protein SAMN04488602_11316 [Paenibacillus sp. cl123]SFW52265.1 hypothetical protein SAMN02799630_03950 [Paenibacillus sp. UNCCL117]